MAAGNVTLWKPSPTTPLCSIAVTKLVSQVLEKNGIPGVVAGLVIGDKEVGENLVGSSHVPLGRGVLSNVCKDSRLELIGFIYQYLSPAVRKLEESWAKTCNQDLARLSLN